MGNCLRKKAAEATEPVGIARPCNGDKRVQLPLPEVISKASIISNSSVSTNDQKERHIIRFKVLGFSTILEDQPVQTLNKISRGLPSYGLNIFPYSVLKTATQKFGKQNLIGQGGFGDVYRGWIDSCTMNATKPGSGRAIAVKKLRKEGHQGHNEWLELNPKLSDFGLAKYGPQGDKSHISTRILGTRGYFAPEYVATGHLTIRTDVYSFGVVLLEIFSGCGAIRKHTDGMAGDLATWATPYLSNRLQLSHVIDRKLRKNLCIEQALEFANIILRCLNHEPKSRPTMNEVVIALEQL
ncbi:Serine/threonine-protein kinase BIK1 [Thalictrum thalictroides]|uniref:Serine/threonine-protein kinase BIK1 n=1 Tax=Thalictrum thalictroides TaxID=46969 RepID=A0A7J6VHW2_THATH|nr:Serine/threonine-protein kinase BIK1 [Thalictrum thalictroides]